MEMMHGLYASVGFVLEYIADDSAHCLHDACFCVCDVYEEMNEGASGRRGGGKEGRSEDKMADGKSDRGNKSKRMIYIQQ